MAASSAPTRRSDADPTPAASTASEAAAAIELEGVTKRYGEVLAVDDLDVRIAQGEFFALLGPSGCGKTSTLKMMAGFEHPDSGRIRLEGEEVTATPPFHRDVNLVFQDYALFPHLNLRDNVAFGLKIKRVSRGERRNRADEMLERMALPGLGDRRISEISGGQQQRVALARALINHPKVLLLDEPLGALDLKLRRTMQLELKAIQRDVGISFVYVTHDQEEALAMADRIAVMSAGKALQIDDPRSIYDHPANRFVADFIGESSFLKGERGVRDGDLIGFRLGDGSQIAARPGLATDSDLAVAMVRPEHTVLIAAEGAEAAGAGWNQLEATVAELEYAGSDVHYFLDTGSGDRMQARMPASAQTFVPGSRVQIRFRPQEPSSSKRTRPNQTKSPKQEAFPTMRSEKRRTRRRAGRAFRLSLTAMLIAAAAALLAACGGSSDDSTGSTASGTETGEATTASLSGDAKACPALNLYTWEGEGGPELVKPFEEKFGVPVKVSYMTSAAEAIAKLAAGGTQQYDLIVAGSEISQPMKEAEVIKPIDTSLIDEYEDLFPFTTEPFEIEGETWGIAADWGVNPFIYSTELVKAPPTSWADLWKPEMKGLVSLWEDISLIWVGASALGMDDNPQELFELSQDQLDEIRDKMLELKGNVRKMWSSGGDLIQLYANGEVGASMGWSYVINELRAQKEPVEEAVLDDMGAQAWSEGPAMSIDIDPDCEAAAYEWINYEISPKGQAALAAESTYTPTNPGAAKFMDKDLIELTGLDDPEAFLGSAILKQAPADPEAYNQTLQEIITGLS